MIAFIARKMNTSKLRLECENHDFFLEMTNDWATVCKLSIVAFQSKLSKEEIEGMGCRVWTINSMTH